MPDHHSVRSVRRHAVMPLVALALACGGDAAAPPPDPSNPPPTATYFPPVTGSAWETTTPAALGWNTAALEAALDWAGTQNSTAVVILSRGRIVAERYWDGWTTTTAGPWFSAGKTVTAALVGQLAAEGRLRLDQPVRELLGNGWSRAPTTEAQITVRHLLTMASGLDDSLRTVTTPGSRFYYNNPAYYQLFDVLQAAAGQSLATVAQTRLFDPLGMRTTFAVASTSVGEPGFIFAGSARDLARFGLLMLNDGRWDGTRVHGDSAFLVTARRPSGTDNLSYGFLWWLNGGASHRVPGPYLAPTLVGPLFPSAPTDLVAALGADDKKLYVVPSLDLVVVRLGPRAPISDSGDAAAISGFDDPFWQRLRLAIGR